MAAEIIGHCTAFIDHSQLAQGSLQDVAIAAKRWQHRDDSKNSAGV